MISEPGPGGRLLVTRYCEQHNERKPAFFPPIVNWGSITSLTVFEDS